MLGYFEIVYDRDLERWTLDDLIKRKIRCTEDSKWGYVVENMVKLHKGYPIYSNSGRDDGGHDLVIDGVPVDVKNSNGDARFFGSKTTRWVVHDYHDLRAPYYLFTQSDIKRGRMVICGWMTREEILNLPDDRKYNDGDIIPGYPRPLYGSAILIKMGDIHPYVYAGKRW